MHPATLSSMHTGRIRWIGGSGGLPSAMEKPSRGGVVQLTPLGLQRDEHADQVDHGGPHQAVHHYPAEHYDRWREDFPELAGRLVPGAFGENFSTTGVTEDTVCLGDIVRLGSVLLEVSQGRTPCIKLTYRFGEPGILRAFLQTGRTGWYYRVLASGPVQAGEIFQLVSRRYPQWPVARLARFRAGQVDRAGDLEELATIEALSPPWREWAAAWYRSHQGRQRT